MELDLPLHLLQKKCDINLEDYPKYCDVFYIGGTKCGLLFGEAVVIINEDIKKEFNFSIKQKRWIICKGKTIRSSVCYSI